jgi:hypothetical protein
VHEKDKRNAEIHGGKQEDSSSVAVRSRLYYKPLAQSSQWEAYYDGKWLLLRLDGFARVLMPRLGIAAVDCSVLFSF